MQLTLGQIVSTAFQVAFARLCALPLRVADALALRRARAQILAESAAAHEVQEKILRDAGATPEMVNHATRWTIPPDKREAVQRDLAALEAAPLNLTLEHPIRLTGEVAGLSADDLEALAGLVTLD